MMNITFSVFPLVINQVYLKHLCPIMMLGMSYDEIHTVNITMA